MDWVPTGGLSVCLSVCHLCSYDLQHVRDVPLRLVRLQLSSPSVLDVVRFEAARGSWRVGFVQSVNQFNCQVVMPPATTATTVTTTETQKGKKAVGNGNGGDGSDDDNDGPTGHLAGAETSFPHFQRVLTALAVGDAVCVLAPGLDVSRLDAVVARHRQQQRSGSDDNDNERETTRGGTSPSSQSSSSSSSSPIDGAIIVGVRNSSDVPHAQTFDVLTDSGVLVEGVSWRALTRRFFAFDAGDRVLVSSWAGGHTYTLTHTDTH